MNIVSFLTLFVVWVIGLLSIPVLVRLYHGDVSVMAPVLAVFWTFVMFMVYLETE